MIMPKIDGKQFIKFIRTKFPGAHFPIVVLSGILIEQLDRLKEIGADYFIVKGPLEKMTEQIHKLLDKIEKDPQSTSGEEFYEPKNLYPRQETAELIDKLNFQRALNECIGVGVIVVDKDAKIIMANSLSLDIINKPFEEVLNQPIITIIPNEERPVLIGALKGILQKPERHKVTFSVTLNAKKILFIVSLLKLDGKTEGWIIVLEEMGQWGEQA
jgi:PAS domain-containing protein